MGNTEVDQEEPDREQKEFTEWFAEEVPPEHQELQASHNEPEKFPDLYVPPGWGIHVELPPNRKKQRRRF